MKSYFFLDVFTFKKIFICIFSTLQVIAVSPEVYISKFLLKQDIDNIIFVLFMFIGHPPTFFLDSKLFRPLSIRR